RKLGRLAGRKRSDRPGFRSVVSSLAHLPASGGETGDLAATFWREGGRPRISRTAPTFKSPRLFRFQLLDVAEGGRTRLRDPGLALPLSGVDDAQERDLARRLYLARHQ